MRWLEKRGRSYYAVMEVPRPLRSVLRKKRMVKSLETRDHHVAIARRHGALAEFQQEFAAARTRSDVAPIVAAGLAYRETLKRIERDDPVTIAQFQGGPEILQRGEYDLPATPRDIARALAMESLYDHVDTLRYSDDAKDREAAATLINVATGAATPLDHYVSAWLAEGGQKGPLNPRTQSQYRSDMLALETWAKSRGLPPLIQTFTKVITGRYVTEALLGNGMDRGTANRKISTASSYWRWLIKRGHAGEINPWQGQSLSKVRVGRDEAAKRPFTDVEVAALMAGDADAELFDTMRVAALSGMRIDEIYRLTVADCAGGWFNLRRSKTPAGRRRVPTHSALAAIIERRTKDMAGDAFLFPEPGPVQIGRERSMAASKRFGRYRQQLAVHEASEGRRQSRVDFHSFRRWFITKARAAHDRAVVAAVVGHEAGNITDDIYSGGPDDAAKRACVESVKLPTPH